MWTMRIRESRNVTPLVEDKTTTLIQGTGSNYKSKAVLINESSLYALVFSSKLPARAGLHGDAGRMGEGKEG